MYKNILNFIREEIKIKATLKYRAVSIRLTETGMLTTRSAGEAVGATGIFVHCWWECKTVESGQTGIQVKRMLVSMCHSFHLSVSLKWLKTKPKKDSKPNQTKPWDPTLKWKTVGSWITPRHQCGDTECWGPIGGNAGTCSRPGAKVTTPCST